MAISQANLDIKQGDDFSKTIYVVSDNGVDPPAPFPLDGYTALAQIRRGAADQCSTVMAEFKTEVTNAAGGEITISLTHDQTRGLQAMRAQWELEITSASNWTQTILGGEANIAAEITRPSPVAVTKAVA